MSRRSPRRRAKRKRPVTTPPRKAHHVISEEDGFRRLQLASLVDAVRDIERAMEDLNRVTAWICGPADGVEAASEEGLSFAEACQAFNREPQAVAAHMLRKVPELLARLAQHSNNPFTP